MEQKIKWKPITIALVMSLFVATAVCKKEEKGDGAGLLLLALLSQQGAAPLYAGFTDIPNSVSQAASNTSSSASTAAYTSIEPTLEGIANVFNPMREVIRFNREVIYHVGTLVYFLKRYDPAGQVWQDTTFWGNQPAKIQYQDDPATTYGADTRKLEVWWNNAPAPYNNQKAIELIFKDPNPGNEKSQDIQGHLWARVLNEETMNSLALVYIEFSYTAATEVGEMKVIVQKGGPGANAGAHMYVRRENGITSVDGTIIVKNITEPFGSTTTNRAYVFSAAGSDELGKAVVRAAFPLETSTNVSVYDNSPTSEENFGEVYTDWLLSDAGIVSYINSKGGSCAAGTINISTDPDPATHSAVNLRQCFQDSGMASDPSLGVLYFIPFIENPGYFSYAFGHVSLVGVGTPAPAAYTTIEAVTMSTVRQGGSPNYSADFLPDTVRQLSIVSPYSGIPSAAQWTDSAGTAPF